MATSVGVAVMCSSQLAHFFVLCAGMYFDHPEIVPDGLQGDFRFNKANEAVARWVRNSFSEKPPKKSSSETLAGLPAMRLRFELLLKAN